MRNRIKEIRMSQNLTQKAFADKLKISVNNIVNYENGRREPTEATIQFICSTFKINENWLKYGEGDMFKAMDREQEIAVIVNEMLSNDSSDFRYQMTKFLYELGPDEIKLLKKIAQRMAERINTSTPDEP